MPASRKYSDDEVRAIIDHALDNEQGARDVSHDELLTIAAEVGLSPESIERAARDVQARRADHAAQLVIVARRRRLLALHAGSFVLINLLLFVVNFLTTPGEWWSLFPIVFWGLALIAHASVALSRNVSERALAREQKRLRGAALGAQQERPRQQRVRLDVDSEAAREADAEQALESESAPDRRHQER